MKSSVAVLVVALLAAGASADDRYPDLSNDFTCATANQAKQAAAFPAWSYDRYAPNAAAQPVELAWEPILESVAGCTGLSDSRDKAFSFTVVLDASWVTYYNANTAFFASQGYGTLAASAYLMVDRVSYLFRKQFGAVIKASAVHSFADLGEACATNNKYVDDGTDATSTLKALARTGATPSSGAGIIRLGIGSLTPGQYCHSSAPVGAVCGSTSILTSQRVPFDSAGKLDRQAVRVLAHELAHFFGVCPSSNAHCLNSHSINELADIQVHDGRPATNARPEGMFSKFMVGCSHLYEDTVCAKVKAASATCGQPVDPPSLAGEYVMTKHGAQANNWHFVTVTETTKNKVFSWTNKAGVSWTLTRNSADDVDAFAVSQSCPYYRFGYTTAKVTTKTVEGVTTVTGIYGPWDELYRLKSTVDPWDPALCPHGNVDATCWADSAYQKCSKDRQGAYNSVAAKASGGQQAMHAEYTRLVDGKVGCTI